MNKYRTSLPQLENKLYLTDGGIETTLIFHDGLELPDFAAFHLFQTENGTKALQKYFRTYAEIAKRFETGLILESATWRASKDWGARLGYTPEALADVNLQAIRMLMEIRKEYESDQTPVVISGCLGPRGDGYIPGNVMTAHEAEPYHWEQIESFANSGADMVSAITMNYVEEAIGITRAAKRANIPVAISFTVETDGNLPTGQSLKSAIEQVDVATSGYPAYYMINCAHPTHFERVVAEGGEWLERIRGVRANASRRSHAELNEAPDLDSGNPVELGAQYAGLTKYL
ncbi:MAG TPA: homocysteine S-methyltransferase family protein, partial [Anaerolineales bacterium]|nr:homocysteine S-methyltransferase family protein [Anaerolineales bacterium]